MVWYKGSLGVGVPGFALARAACPEGWEQLLLIVVVTNHPCVARRGGRRRLNTRAPAIVPVRRLNELFGETGPETKMMVLIVMILRSTMAWSDLFAFNYWLLVAAAPCPG